MMKTLTSCRRLRYCPQGHKGGICERGQWKVPVPDKRELVDKHSTLSSVHHPVPPGAQQDDQGLRGSRRVKEDT